jgi:adenine-specific DNA-methyltransferase
MPVCETCEKSFKDLTKHKSKKIPCKKLKVKTLEEFRDSSKSFNKSLTKEIRSQQGIYFTPKKVREYLFKVLADLGLSQTTKPKVILEPSFGSGEFLLDARERYPDSQLLGVEKNEELFKSLNCEGAKLTNADFLEWEGSADLIIGNPPYFVMDTTDMNSVEKKAFSKKYSDCMTGRPNIYIAFLYNCLEKHLEDDGVLAFILPTSIYNCSYYQPMRDYIEKNTTILHLENLNKPGFYETGQEVALLVLQKKKSNNNFIFKAKNGSAYVSPFYEELQELTKGTVSLVDLGLAAKTGNVVWNQVKDNLSNTPGTLLIYSSNINDSILTLNNLNGEEKKQYVTGLTKPKLSGPVILVERGYGNSFSFNTVLVTEKEFYAENHVNVIYAKTPGLETEEKLKRVIKSFHDPRTEQFVKWFSGNGMLCATDLETLIPIF